MSAIASPPTERHCLVTIGATARFTQLLHEVLQPDFLNHLAANNFTHLTLQCGTDLAQVREDLLALVPRPALQIATFAFVDDLVPDMVRCRADPAAGRAAGAVIAHAGTFTLLSISHTPS
jgi:beta-1,4-N-acetylglucosaminyltransferase